MPRTKATAKLIDRPQRYPLRPLVEEQHRLFEYTLRNLDYVDLNQEQRTYLHRYFIDSAKARNTN